MSEKRSITVPIGSRWRPKDRRSKWTLTVRKTFGGFDTTEKTIVYSRDNRGTDGLGIYSRDEFPNYFVRLDLP